MTCHCRASRWRPACHDAVHLVDERNGNQPLFSAFGSHGEKCHYSLLWLTHVFGGDCKGTRRIVHAYSSYVCREIKYTHGWRRPAWRTRDNLCSVSCKSWLCFRTWTWTPGICPFPGVPKAALKRTRGCVADRYVLEIGMLHLPVLLWSDLDTLMGWIMGNMMWLERKSFKSSGCSSASSFLMDEAMGRIHARTRLHHSKCDDKQRPINALAAASSSSLHRWRATAMCSWWMHCSEEPSPCWACASKCWKQSCCPSVGDEIGGQSSVGAHLLHDPERRLATLELVGNEIFQPPGLSEEGPVRASLPGRRCRLAGSAINWSKTLMLIFYLIV